MLDLMLQLFWKSRLSSEVSDLADMCALLRMTLQGTAHTLISSALLACLLAYTPRLTIPRTSRSFMHRAVQIFACMYTLICLPQLCNEKMLHWSILMSLVNCNNLDLTILPEFHTNVAALMYFGGLQDDSTKAISIQAMMWNFSFIQTLFRTSAAAQCALNVPECTEYAFKLIDSH